MARMKRGKTIIFVREAATEDLGLVPGMYGPVQGPVSRKSRKRFGHGKPFVKLLTACFGKPIF